MTRGEGNRCKRKVKGGGGENSVNYKLVKIYLKVQKILKNVSPTQAQILSCVTCYTWTRSRWFWHLFLSIIMSS